MSLRTYVKQSLFRLPRRFAPRNDKALRMFYTLSDIAEADGYVYDRVLQGDGVQGGETLLFPFL